MKLTELFLAELEREADRTKRAVTRVPAGKDDWKPHDKSMPLARLAGLVATMPSWISLIIDQPELDIAPPEGQGEYQQPAVDQLAGVLDNVVEKARASLQKTTDEYLMTTNWKLLAGGKVVMDLPRHIVLRDTLNHLAHHRGQLTVYLRQVGAKVPAIYGDSADERVVGADA